MEQNLFIWAVTAICIAVASWVISYCLEFVDDYLHNHVLEIVRIKNEMKDLFKEEDIERCLK